MSFVDTSFLVDFLREEARGEHGKAHRKLESMEDEALRASVFVACELMAGAELSKRSDEADRVQAVLDRCELVYPDERFAPAYARAWSATRRSGVAASAMDLLIGVAAMVEDEPLITRNVKDFGRIPGLRVDSY